MTLMGRVLRGVREHVRTQIVSVATVALALFCLAGALLITENMGVASKRWSAPVRVTVYMNDGATPEQIETLRRALGDLPEVADTRYVSPVDARATLAAGETDGVLANAAVDLFPATIEIRLNAGASDAEHIQSLARRVKQLQGVTDVETYAGLTEQFHSMLSGGKMASLIIAVVVLVCATAVVGNTVRLSLNARMREVEVLRLVGASPRYVRAPFLLEGALLGGGGALIALAALGGIFVWMRMRFEPTMGALIGMRPAFLSWAVMAVFLLGGGLLGTTGSALALRRGLRV
jgi:cell division transport system permease protein